jgi:valyl-tRNA synthetase
MLHPFTPFITEELWGYLRKAVLGSRLSSLAKDWAEALIIASWPEPRQEEGWETSSIADFSLIQEIVRAIRNLRAEKNVKPGKLIPAIIVAAERTKMIQQQKNMISALGQLDPEKLATLDTLSQKPENHVALVIGSVEIYLPLEGLVDISEERARLSKALTETDGQVVRLENLLASSFAEKAPAGVVQKERDKLAGYKDAVAKLKNQLDALD